MRSCSDIVIVAELASRRKNAGKDRLVPYITLSFSSKFIQLRRHVCGTLKSNLVKVLIKRVV